MKKNLLLVTLVLIFIFSSCQIDVARKNNENFENQSILETANVVSTYDSPLMEQTYMGKILSVSPWNYNSVLDGMFIDILGDETANVLDNGKAFAMLSNGGGMGKEGWKPVYTQDGGDTWIEGNDYFVEPLGYKDFAVLENGMILHFLFPYNYYGDNASASDVQVLTFNEETKTIEKESVENWFDVFKLEDNLSYAVTYAHYIGNNTLSIKIDEIIKTPDENAAGNRTGKCLYYGNVVLDPKTMLPIQFTEIDEKKKTSDGSLEQGSSKEKISEGSINNTDNLSYEQKLCTIDPWSRFLTERASGTAKEVTFLDLLIMNRANVIANGKAFVITYSDSVGMSQVTGTVYFTENGGMDWENVGYYSRINSAPLLMVAFDNGKILSFHGPDELTNLQTPVVNILNFNLQNKHLDSEGVSGWFDIFETSSQIYISEIACVGKESDMLKDGGYKIKLQLISRRNTDAVDSKVLFDGYVIIDPDTLQPISIEDLK